METQEARTIRDFFENRTIGSKIVRVAVIKMTRDEAREVYPYRPRSRYSESYFGGDTLLDDIALLLNRMAFRCKMCEAATKNDYLIDGVCPDCDGRSEANGIDPHK